MCSHTCVATLGVGEELCPALRVHRVVVRAGDLLGHVAGQLRVGDKGRGGRSRSVYLGVCPWVASGVVCKGELSLDREVRAAAVGAVCAVQKTPLDRGYKTSQVGEIITGLLSAPSPAASASPPIAS